MTRTARTFLIADLPADLPDRLCRSGRDPGRSRSGGNPVADRAGTPGTTAPGGTAPGRPTARGRTTLRLLGAGLAATALATTVAACGGGKDKPTGPLNVTVTRGQEASAPFASTGGEVILDLGTASPEASWGTNGGESAVVSLYVDDTYTTDLVIPASFSIPRSLDLGNVPAGDHTLKVKFADDRSPAAAHTANLTNLKFRTVTAADAGFAATQYAPVIYGRTGQGATPDVSGPFQSAVTDTPMVEFHTEAASPTTGNKIYRYSVIYSNEDGAASVPETLAQWGRSTDIAWVYQVEVNAAGQVVPGSAAVQGQDGSTVPFTGGYEGTHAVVQTCGLANSVCGKTDGQMRFSLSALDSLDPRSEAPEGIMDRNPWTYWMMSQELVREGKTAEDPIDDPTGSPTQLAGDPRSYLYLVLRKSTQGTPNTDAAWVGVSVGVKLAGNPTIYRSDLGVAKWSLRRDEPAATAIELPPGTVAEDIEQIRALRVVGLGRDTKATVQVESIERAFFLDADYKPQESFLFAPVKATLTSASPAVTLLDRANGPIIRTSASPTGSADPNATPSSTDTPLLPGITISPSMSVNLPGGKSPSATATQPSAPRTTDASSRATPTATP
ncbi:MULTISPECIES: hypothetical protein [unclassified Pseudofrankia]|uniref:hypothetical protein n=1 Tax=unclassified Pseudofrankia TaxID=2994372 RepID=UPI000AFC00B5|nr:MULTISPECIES: hypothetical protein [unclassified Pseudofrankia]MDT3441266.1 hypothetical protein [Pseudofrankia sp. BMG5.37]